MAAVEVSTLIAIAGSIAVPSLGSMAWLLRTLGHLRTGQSTMSATIEGMAIKIDDIATEQANARTARGEIRGELATHDKRLSLTEHDINRWISESR